MTTYRPPENPRREKSFPQTSQAQLGMWVFLASLGVLFAASIVAYLITRAQSSLWREGMPSLPAGLFASTALILAQAGAFRLAERALAKNALDRFQARLTGALALGVGFLLVQAMNWRQVLSASEGLEVRSLYLFSFYMLTALHALHVLGGIFSLVYVTYRAFQGSYSSSNAEALRLNRQYWDFLAVVWLVLLGTLAATS